MIQNWIRRNLRLSLAVVAFALTSGSALAQFEGVTYEGVDDLPEIRLSWSDWASPVSRSGIAAQAMADYIAAASHGKITMEIYWSASLTTPPETAAGIASGLADMGMVPPVYHPADFPIHNWLQPIGNLARGGAMFGRMAINAAYVEFIREQQVMLDEFADNNVVPLSFSGSIPYSLFCNSPIHTLADAVGKRTRTAGQIFSELADSLGMVPVPIQANEVYEALTRGILDCVIFPVNAFIDYGFPNISGDKFYIHSEFSIALTAFFGINRDTWESLPPVAKQIVADGALVHYFSTGTGELPKLQDWLAIIDSGAVTAIEPDTSFKEALVAAQDAQVAALSSNAPDSVSDPQSVLDTYMAYIDKWQNIVGELGVAELPVGDMDSAFASWRGDSSDWRAYINRLREELAKPGV